jgi:hypothetical protein
MKVKTSPSVDDKTIKNSGLKMKSNQESSKAIEDSRSSGSWKS